ncbi:MAG: dihydropteroate synthase [Peptococcaceae bacterium]|nr:dihydropteroate synthase [Peptococcaceae bacterium]
MLQRIFRCRDYKMELGKKTLIMGILNLTPDSFSDGGKFFNLDLALKHAELLVSEGADILDIGAESTRPGYVEISPEEEWARLEPVLKELIGNCPIPISVDTQKAVVVEKALKIGVHIINDIGGLQKDPLIAKVIGEYQAGVIIMHNRHNTEYQNLMADIITFLEESIQIALFNGIKEDQIIIDPGIGFGKTLEQNIEVMQKLPEFKVFKYPILLGVSRKSIIGKSLGLPVKERLEPTIALGALGIAAGVDILRVHDARENKNAARMADRIVRC